jgi:hypothetical protein
VANKRNVVKRLYPHPDDYIYEKFHFQEMADSLSKIAQRLFQYEAVRLEHLLKVYYFRDFQMYLNGWITSIYKCNIQIPKNVNTNKYPTYKFIYKNLWENEIDAFEDHHEGYISTFASYKYLPKIENPDLEGVFLFCEEYFKWLSLQLSQEGKITLEEVKEKLNSLLEEIPYTL